MPKISVELTDGTYTQFVEACLDEHRKHVDQIRLLIEEWLEGKVNKFKR